MERNKRRVDKNIWSLFFFYRFQRSKHSAWWKKGRSKIESNRGMETTGSKHTRPFVALYILSICSTLLDGAKLCPLFYFETFFILSSRAEKFSSIACRFSFIVCWTWWGEKWNMTEKKQNWSTYEASERVTGHKIWFSLFGSLISLIRQNFIFPIWGAEVMTPKASCYHVTAVSSVWGTSRVPGVMLDFLPVLGGCYCPSECCWSSAEWCPGGSAAGQTAWLQEGQTDGEKDRVSIAAQNLQPRICSDLNCWLRQQQS